MCIGKQGKVREGIKKLSSYEALVMGLATLHEPLWVWPVPQNFSIFFEMERD